MATKVSNRMIKGARVNVLDFGATGDGVTDDTLSIQAALDYAKDNGRVTVYFPTGRYITTSGLLVDGSHRIEGEGRGFRDNLGTVVERQEGAGSTDPIFTIGTGQSIPNFTMTSLTLVGDTTVRHDGVYCNVSGMHKPIFEKVHVNYVQGKPFHIISTTDVARPEFLTFRDINIGEDFGTYGGRPSEKSRSDDPDCVGIYTNDQSGTGNGTIDQINIEDCVILGKSNGFNAGVRAEDGDVLRIVGSSINGMTYAVDTRNREFTMSGGYIEGVEWAYVIRNNFGNVNRGCKVFDIGSTLIASSRNTMLVNDDSATIQGSTRGQLSNIFIFSNFTTWSQGHDVFTAMGPNSLVEVSNIATMMSNENPGLTGCRMFAAGMANTDRVIGQNSVFRNTKRIFLENPEITSNITGGLGNYRFDVNDTTSTDLGMRIYDKDDQQLVTFLPSDSVTVDKTSLFIYCAHTGTLEQVEVGAADSAGTGFRTLRVSNT